MHSIGIFGEGGQEKANIVDLNRQAIIKCLCSAQLRGIPERKDAAVTVTISETKASTTLVNKGLISDQLWTRLTKRIAKDENVSLTLAERIMDQTLAFLVLCAAEPNNYYSPRQGALTPN